MRDGKSADDIVSARLRAVAGDFSDTTPLTWSDIVPGWGEELDPASLTLEAIEARAAATPAPGPDHDDAEPVLSGAGAFGPPGRRGRLSAFDPGRPGVRALTVVAVVVVVIAALLAWRARPRVDPVALPPVPVDSAPAVDSRSAAAEVVVAVGGRVRRPGLVRLSPGARVADALRAAGGAQGGVDVSPLNLARKVVDGELIMVGVTPPPGAAGPPAAGGPGATSGGLVNLNTATLADLDRLPGVGPVLAQRILDARAAQGGFRAVADLRKVDGIGDSRYQQLKELVTV